MGTDRSVHVVDEFGSSVFTAPLAYNRDEYGLVRIARLDNPKRYVVWYYPSSRLGLMARRSMPQHLVEYDVGGDEIGRRSVPPELSAKSSPAKAWFGLATPMVEHALFLGVTYDLVFGSSSDQANEAIPISSTLLEVSGV